MTEDHEETMREYLLPEREDEDAFLTPQTPSQLARLSDAEVLRLYRKLARGHRHPWDRRIELELIGALRSP